MPPNRSISAGLDRRNLAKYAHDASTIPRPTATARQIFTAVIPNTRVVRTANFPRLRESAPLLRRPPRTVRRPGTTQGWCHDSPGRGMSRRANHSGRLPNAAPVPDRAVVAVPRRVPHGPGVRLRAGLVHGAQLRPVRPTVACGRLPCRQPGGSPPLAGLCEAGRSRPHRGRLQQQINAIRYQWTKPTTRGCCRRWGSTRPRWSSARCRPRTGPLRASTASAASPPRG